MLASKEYLSQILFSMKNWMEVKNVIPTSFKPMHFIYLNSQLIPSLWSHSGNCSQWLTPFAPQPSRFSHGLIVFVFAHNPRPFLSRSRLCTKSPASQSRRCTGKRHLTTLRKRKPLAGQFADLSLSFFLFYIQFN